MIIKLHIPILRFDNKKSQNRLDHLRKISDPRVVQEVSCISQEMRTGQVDMTQLTGNLDISGDNNSIINEADQYDFRPRGCQYRDW
jgi:hypothetical protein